MKIYLYYKVDRGYAESAHAAWRRQGGSFDDHLLRTQHTLHTWVREWRRLGHTVHVDLRSSFLLPQARRARLPLAAGKLLRAALWASQVDVALLQQDVLRQVARFDPDVVFVPLGSSLRPGTLRALKARGRRLAQWCGLPATTMLERDRANLPYFDLILQPANLADGLRAAGAVGRIEYVPIGIDPEVHRPLALTDAERARYGADVCFIGGLSQRFHQSRRAMVEHALRQGVQMKIWGGYREHFVGSPILDVWQGQVWGEEQVKALCAARIGLNFHVDHQPGELDQGLNVRAFELPACGVFQLLQRVPSVPQFFEEGREIVCFETPAEMLEKIRYYLAQPEERARIAQAGHVRVLRDHTWASRVQPMLALFAALL